MPTTRFIPMLVVSVFMVATKAQTIPWHVSVKVSQIATAGAQEVLPDGHVTHVLIAPQGQKTFVTHASVSCEGPQTLRIDDMGVFIETITLNPPAILPSDFNVPGALSAVYT